MADVQKHSVHTLVFRSLKRSHEMFLSDYMNKLSGVPEAEESRRRAMMSSEYKMVSHLPPEEQKKKKKSDEAMEGVEGQGDQRNQLAIYQQPQQATSNSNKIVRTGSGVVEEEDKMKQQLIKRAPQMLKPTWHAPWKLYRVISGHLGWVRCVAFEPNNEWFVTGSADRVIKLWDLASGTLKLSLTGHISAVRGVVVSKRHPYMFSAGEDKTVKCWDLEYNKVIRHYHGHLSAVQSIDLHPALDLLVTSGRDSTARLWDMRTKQQIHCMGGHSNTVAEVRCQAEEPQIITGSHDSTVRLWDIVAGKTRVTLTNHKKSVRAIAIHPTQYTFASGSPDNVNEWKCPDGVFLQNLSGHNAIINSVAVNSENVLVSAADNGSMFLWDWRSGYNFQRIQAPVQPGSIDSEAGIFAVAFDHTGSRLITCEADKTIKLYKEDFEATEETHPINWKAGIARKSRY